MFLLALIVLAVRALRRLRTGFGRGLAVGNAACLVAFLLDSMGANLITQFVLLIYVLALTAVVQAWVIRAPEGETAHDPVSELPPQLGDAAPTNGPALERQIHGAP
jgi:hypothetical protein